VHVYKLDIFTVYARWNNIVHYATVSYINCNIVDINRLSYKFTETAKNTGMKTRKISLPFLPVWFIRVFILANYTNISLMMHAFQKLSAE